MKFTKVLFGILCLILLSAALFAGAGDAAESGDDGNVHWDLDDEGKLTISGSGAMKNYCNDDGSSVSPWYQYNKLIKSVDIEDGVTSVGNQAFWECSSLTSINIPDSVTYIGDGAFWGCSSLTSINIPNSVKILDGAFRGSSSLISITIPDNVTSLVGTFADCTSLTSITIPNSVTSLDSAFSGCSSLTSVNIPDSVKNLDYAFSGCTSLTSITIPNSVTSLYYTFSGCTSLTSVHIPESVTTIGSDTFTGCTSLHSITIPASVTSISNAAFSNLPDNFIIYTSGNPSYLIDKYDILKTAVAKVNEDGTYTFTSSVPNLSLTSANAPTKDNYSWWPTDGKSTTPVTSITSGTNPTLYWGDALKCTITFNSNNGSAVASQQVTAGECAVPPANPEFEDYTFAGWYLDTGLTLAYDFTKPVKKNLTLYAKWSDGSSPSPQPIYTTPVPATPEDISKVSLKSGWNFISIPKPLDTSLNTAEKLFAGIDSGNHAVLVFDGETQTWKEVKSTDSISPITGYWVYSTNAAVINLKYTTEPTAPAVKTLYPGWNAVGISANSATSGHNAFSMVDWSVAIPWNIQNQNFETALVKNGTGENADESLIGLLKGVWLYVTEKGTLAGLTGSGTGSATPTQTQTIVPTPSPTIPASIAGNWTYVNSKAHDTTQPTEVVFKTDGTGTVTYYKQNVNGPTTNTLKWYWDAEVERYHIDSEAATTYLPTAYYDLSADGNTLTGSTAILTRV